MPYNIPISANECAESFKRTLSMLPSCAPTISPVVVVRKSVLETNDCAKGGGGGGGAEDETARAAALARRKRCDDRDVCAIVVLRRVSRAEARSEDTKERRSDVMRPNA